MIRKAISNQLKFILKTCEGLEETRAKDYSHQLGLSLDERAGYNNLTNSIMHWEGRAKEARSILRMIDDLEVSISTDLCEHCSHHEVGYHIRGRKAEDIKFVALRPGQRILVQDTL